MTFGPGRVESALGEHHAAAAPGQWVMVSVLPATTPVPAPRQLSHTVTAPTRLSRFARSYLLDPGTAGNFALEWTFNETNPATANQEWEVAFYAGYTSGGVPHAFSTSVYFETQAASPAATLLFTLVWDSGATTGIVISSELEVAQPCSAVGTCP
jgi:hypothetical protein